MTWRSFMDYWLMRELGQLDSICRNYKLENPRHNDNHNYVYAATKRMGIEVASGNWAWAVHEVMARLQSYGYYNPNFHKVRVRLNEWYVWDRIRTGDLKRGHLVGLDNPIL